MVDIKTLASWDTTFSADSVEWCPEPGLDHLFVCGTYQLTEGREEAECGETPAISSPVRLGQLHLMCLLDSEQVIERVQTVEMPAVLDCKWAPQKVLDNVLLAVANAVGQLCIYKLLQDGVSCSPELEEETAAELPREEEETDLLTLSLDWAVSADCVRLATSNSRGRVSVFRLDSKAGLQIEQNWTAHQFEAWIVHFDPYNWQVCFTGGDDCKLRVYDLRCDPAVATATNTTHSAGVTTLSCAKRSQHVMLSGSYDEQVREWDTRQLRSPVRESSVGGGVWRLKWRPLSEDLVLAACMYNGFHILSRSLEVVAEQRAEHRSILYGADWSHLSSGSTQHFPSLLQGDSSVIGTCSFYDHKLCVHTVTAK